MLRMTGGVERHVHGWVISKDGHRWTGIGERSGSFALTAHAECAGAAAVAELIVSLRRIPLSKEMTMQSTIIKRSIVVAGHRTSVSIEDPFWNALKEIGRSHKTTIAKLVGEIDTRRSGNLSSAIRLFVLGHFRAQLSGMSPEPAAAGVQMSPISQDQHQIQHMDRRSPEHHQL